MSIHSQYEIIIHKDGIMIEVLGYDNKLFCPLLDFSGGKLSTKALVRVQAILLMLQESETVQYDIKRMGEIYAKWENLLLNKLVCPCNLEKETTTFLAELHSEYAEYVAKQKEKLRDALDKALSAASLPFSDEDIENVFRESFVRYVLKQ